ncbi:hypothetical protein E2542_SST26997 [Spatholobus suberectus]|nr:hypothetical protein E2542_SST26997 [Spatholobus suberectus]
MPRLPQHCKICLADREACYHYPRFKAISPLFRWIMLLWRLLVGSLKEFGIVGMILSLIVTHKSRCGKVMGKEVVKSQLSCVNFCRLFMGSQLCQRFEISFHPEKGMQKSIFFPIYEDL